MLMNCACEGFEVQFHRDDVAPQLAAERMSTMLLVLLHGDVDRFTQHVEAAPR